MGIPLFLADPNLSLLTDIPFTSRPIFFQESPTKRTAERRVSSRAVTSKRRYVHHRTVLATSLLVTVPDFDLFTENNRLCPVRWLEDWEEISDPEMSIATLQSMEMPFVL